MIQQAARPSFRRRAAATAIDLALLAAVGWALALAGVWRLPIDPEPYGWIDGLAVAVVQRWPRLLGLAGAACTGWILYVLLARASRRATLGERAWGLHLVDWRGADPSMARLLVRSVLGPTLALPGGIGWLWAWVDAEGQSWADRLAGVRLVHGAVTALPPRGGSG